MKKLKQEDLFKNVPSEIMIDILSRVPVQTILSCKCVCKWLHDLVETHEFAQFHLSKSILGIALTIGPSYVKHKTLEVTNVNLPDLHLSTIMVLNFTYHNTSIQGSVDGLLLLSTYKHRSSELYLCNPITREAINLHSRTRPFGHGVFSYGFGVSKISGQYKAVRIWVDKKTCESECKVYTIGTGSWRSIGPVRFRCEKTRAVFVNGNLHWYGHDLKDDNPLVSCFDLETEVFTTFSPPPLPYKKSSVGVVLAAAAEDSLCLCDCTAIDGTVIIWLMKEKSWTKEFVITDIGSILPEPLRVSKDGVILMSSSPKSLMYYSSKKNKTSRIISNSQGCFFVSSLSYIPSFLSLECFRTENSFSFGKNLFETFSHKSLVMGTAAETGKGEFRLRKEEEVWFWMSRLRRR
ncbi:hypothetical protein ACS0TY_007551 [Phlomoides rotata]